MGDGTCHLVWQVRKILELDQTPLKLDKTPAGSPGR